MTLDELVNDINMYLTMSGSLPRVLNDMEITRLIENEAKPYFYKNNYWSLLKSYLYVPRESFKIDKFTKYRYVELPCNIQQVVWLYSVNDVSLMNLGVSSPSLSVNLGVTNQPYLSSYTTTVGELGVYKVIIDGFTDMLNQLSKHTLKFAFNQSSKQLNILTSMSQNPYEDCSQSLILEVYEKIDDIDLFDQDLFRRYCRAKAGMQLGRLLLRYDYSLPGGVKINSDAVLSEAKEDMTKVEEEMKAQNPNTSFFFMVKR